MADRDVGQTMIVVVNVGGATPQKMHAADSNRLVGQIGAGICWQEPGFVCTMRRTWHVSAPQHQEGKRNMFNKCLPRGLFLAVLCIGCSNGDQLIQNSAPDPIQQAIEAQVKAQGPKETPPGFMMNSGGELVPVNDLDQL
jgi:hypothetical protein